MTEKISNQTENEIRKLKEAHDQEIAKLKRALYAERKKSFWQKLFG